MTSETPAQIPTGWRMAKIGELFESWGGHTPSKSNRRYWGPGLPWISSKEVKSTRLKTSTYEVTQEAIDETGLRVCPIGSVLVVMRSGILAHTLPVAVTEVPVTINQDLKAFYSDEPFLNEWLALFLRMSAHRLLASSRRDGTTVQSIQYPLLKSTMIPVPPVEDRRLIIEAVNVALAKQSAIPPRLASARRVIERFRQAVLAAACSGRLTEGWRNAWISLADMPAGWQSIPFADVCEHITVGHVGKMITEYQDQGIPFLRSQNVRELRFDSKDIKYISPEFHHRLKKSELRPGDIVIVRSGFVGTACVIPDSLSEANCSDLVIARPGPRLRSQYGAIFVNSPQMKAHINDVKVGSAQSHFNTRSM